MQWLEQVWSLPWGTSAGELAVAAAPFTQAVGWQQPVIKLLMSVDQRCEQQMNPLLQQHQRLPAAISSSWVTCAT
jgi:hypothetical protein